MLREEVVRSFDYIWIIRCSGTDINRNIEYRLMPQVPINGLRPLIEAIGTGIFNGFAQAFRRRYGEIMVDFPHYLLEKSSKFRSSVQELETRYSNPVNFFQAFRNLIDIPVVSARDERYPNYDAENTILQNIKDYFDKVAVRIRVPTFDLSGASLTLSSYRALLETMDESDLLLLDVFSLSDVENQINTNLALMSRLCEEMNIEIFVLNAFEPLDLKHNFGPLFSYRYNLDGFGDFATEKRFPAGGGRVPRKILRYYYWDRHELKEFAHSTYHRAASQLRRSAYWNNHLQHIPSCVVCDDVNNNNFTEDHSYWKRFRILHYLNAIANETRQQYSSATSAEDLDPDGYDILFNVGEN